MNKAILRLAIPNIISNITVPLLSIVDMSIVGHLKESIFISAIAIAVIMFNFMYWSFSFLRMGTSGFTAQAYGAKNEPETFNILVRSLIIALTVGFFIIILQQAIFSFFIYILKAENTLIPFVANYFFIYVWAAPAVLGMYTFSGWFIGMQDSKSPMLIAISINIINILLSLIFVFILRMELKGVALASTIAQYIGILIAFCIWFFKYKKNNINFRLLNLNKISSYKPFFKVNSDIFIRTLLLITVTTFFTSQSSKMGANILAANALLMQLFTLFSYMMDGFAYAAEALTGRFIGAKQFDNLKKMIRLIFLWGTGFALFFTIGYSLFTEPILGILTDKTEIISICEEYRLWILLIPIAGFSAFLWDGIFVGAMASKQMRNSMIVAALLFFIIYYAFQTQLANNALWLAFICYLSTRGFMQAFLYYKRIENTLK